MDLVGRLPFGSRPATTSRGSGRNLTGATRRERGAGGAGGPALRATDAAANELRTERRSAATAAATARPAARTGADVLRRERHQPDYSILLAVVSLAAIGILMVFSSSAMHAYIERDDTLAIVGPQIFWGALGILAMVAVMRMDYRWLRLVSVPAYGVALVLLVLVFVPSLNRVVGGSARWLVVGPLPAVHPAEIAKLALIIYLAHWMANKGRRISGF